jgi:hypothetical protein
MLPPFSSDAQNRLGAPHRAYLTRTAASGYLPPFAHVHGVTGSLVGRHAPDYDDGSVIVGLAPPRPSPGASSRTARARRRCPVRFLHCTHGASPSGQGVVWTQAESRHTDGAGSTDVLSAGVTGPPLDTGLQAIQLSPYRAGMAGRRRPCLQAAPAFQPCSCPFLRSDSGQVVASKSSALNFGHLGWLFTRCAAWRTLSPHPALQCLTFLTCAIMDAPMALVADDHCFTLACRHHSDPEQFLALAWAMEVF